MSKKKVEFINLTTLRKHRPLSVDDTSEEAKDQAFEDKFFLQTFYSSDENMTFLSPCCRIFREKDWGKA